ncbi:peptidase M61 [Subsaxibacter sp. CAU 1640]|uniref:M61 family metallopeptidase n=1 Tax=Subsaxibacter sp. CAU 1640 TaxID=2933271 RepID=UPI0020051691|nr:peptidase M61 [Subsaxibacter sp. CAU 1640]MCK7589704.1 peptidase M61 [Subsaxibacter sp. CAU 1640]
MIRFLPILLISFIYYNVHAQVASTYSISFEKAVHHEATISATFSNLKRDTVEITMARSSPGRYALHEFVKNVYNVKATDDKGKELNISRKDPYSWMIEGHNGTVTISYTLFANHGDGTYAQVDETHAHLNIPATFIYVPELADQQIEVNFILPENSDWKIATQLKLQNDNRYHADNLQYFMDSPVEIANFKKHFFKVKGQTINVILHDHAASEEQFDTYFENVKKLVLEQEQVFGELPRYDYGEYTFLACYMPNATGDGMEHRNSTMIPSTRSLSFGGNEQNIGTVAHEFFHCWNVERIRPDDLEPFDFQKTNMSDALWFAEGFTNYYDALSQCRTGIWTQDYYFKDMIRGFNYVWTSPGRAYFNPIGMSQLAPFNDAAKSIDETNFENIFISYYSYGEMLGLALDLSLREKDLNLDDFMKLMWTDFGKVQKFYSVDDLHQTLKVYAGKKFADDFFTSYIYKSGMPDFERLFNQMGVVLKTNEDIAFGATVRFQKIMRNPKIGSSAYEAGLQNGDKLIRVGLNFIDDNTDIASILKNYSIGEKIPVVYERFGIRKETQLMIKTETSYDIVPLENHSKQFDENMKRKRREWLGSKL